MHRFVRIARLRIGVEKLHLLLFSIGEMLVYATPATSYLPLRQPTESFEFKNYYYYHFDYRRVNYYGHLRHHVGKNILLDTFL